MPKDEVCTFISVLRYTPTTITFPNNEVLEWDEPHDWISCDETRFIFIKNHIGDTGSWPVVIIGLIASPLMNTTPFNLFECVPNYDPKLYTRGWLLKDYFLISPFPVYEHAMFTIRIPIGAKPLYYQAMPSLVGVFVKYALVDKGGDHFLIYNYEADYIVVFDKDFKILKTWRSSCCPLSIERAGSTLTVTQAERWDMEKRSEVKIELEQ